jgi:serine/threonine protein kinase
MAPKLPERYETRVRLGRDGDVEEWLASDSSLDRPVLVRILDSRADLPRRRDFIDAARAAAAAHHVGLAEVYAVGSTKNPYAVLEWHGGVSVADRLRAGETLTVSDFLINGPRLASGLAALHEAGAVHGALDVAAIGFAGGQPAKLGAFGRRPLYDAPRDDTAALAAALRIALTGSDIAGVRPSEVAEGLPHGIDPVLAKAEDRAMTAAGLAASLRAHRPPEVAERRSTWSWKWTAISATLVGAALLLSAAGIAIEVDPESPFLFPAVPADATAPSPIVGDPAPTIDSEALTAEAVGYDPFGNDFPNDDDLAMVIDDGRSTAWRTDSYSGPLREVSQGIGISFIVAGTPRFVEIVATPDTRYEVRWAPEMSDTLFDWEKVFSGTVLEGANLVRVPERTNGRWLFWLTDVPEGDGGRFFAEVRTVRFLP